jgi:GT2 family glycosyltransferase
LLNSDAFVQPGSISALLAEIERLPRTGVAGPRLLNQDGSLQVSCFRFPSPARVWIENSWLSALFPRSAILGDYRRWKHDVRREVEWVVGACMLVRREVFDAVGGFDESFFMYAEESDWQLRIRKAGWKVIFTPDARVVHIGGASGAAEAARINRNFFDSLDHYVRKHHGVAGLLSMRIAMGIGCSLRMLLWLGNSLIAPANRQRALKKCRFHAALALRQLSFWNLLSVRA